MWIPIFILTNICSSYLPLTFNLSIFGHPPIINIHIRRPQNARHLDHIMSKRHQLLLRLMGATTVAPATAVR